MKTYAIEFQNIYILYVLKHYSPMRTSCVGIVGTESREKGDLGKSGMLPFEGCAAAVTDNEAYPSAPFSL